MEKKYKVTTRKEVEMNKDEYLGYLMGRHRVYTNLIKNNEAKIRRYKAKLTAENEQHRLELERITKLYDEVIND